MGKQVILDFPGEVPEEGVRDPEILKEAKTGAILEMLRKGIIPQERAASLLEIDLEALCEVMEAHGIPWTEAIPAEPGDPTLATAGAWKGLLDCRTFERDVYDSRQRAPRPDVRL